MVQVSVILPTYNRAAFIVEAIDSVLAQSFRDVELIVVDDGSTDDTPQRVEQISDPRLIYIRQPNRGRSNARNHALGLAKGKYIAFLDSDDFYLPGKLELQVDFLENHPDIGMVYTSASCIDEHGDLLPFTYHASASGDIYEDIAFFQPVTITLPTVMVRREIIAEAGSFDTKMDRFEDTDMWRRISKLTLVEGLPELTCKLRTHSDNTLASQNPDKIISSIDYYVGKVLREDRKISRDRMKRKISQLYLYYARAMAKVPGWRMKALYLTARAVYFWPPYFLKPILYPPYMLARKIYYHTIYFMYLAYKRIRRRRG